MFQNKKLKRNATYAIADLRKLRFSLLIALCPPLILGYQDIDPDIRFTQTSNNLTSALLFLTFDLFLALHVIKGFHVSFYVQNASLEEYFAILC